MYFKLGLYVFFFITNWTLDGENSEMGPGVRTAWIRNGRQRGKGTEGKHAHSQAQPQTHGRIRNSRGARQSVFE